MSNDMTEDVQFYIIVTKTINHLNLYLSFFLYRGRTQDLEEEQPSVEQELRRLIEKPGESFRGIHLAHSTQQKQNVNLRLRYVCVCVCRSSENCVGPEERKAADGETDGDR